MLEPFNDRVRLHGGDGARVHVGGETGFDGDLAFEDQFEHLRIVKQGRPVPDAVGMQFPNCETNLCSRPSLTRMNRAAQPQVPRSPKRWAIVGHGEAMLRGRPSCEVNPYDTCVGGRGLPHRCRRD